MLDIKVNMNSSSEKVLAFKTCCGLNMMDQNLEFLVTNQSNSKVWLKGYFDLVLPEATKRIATLVPPGRQAVEPGECKAFYCHMDEQIFQRATAVVFFDESQKTYRVAVNTK